MPEYIIKWDCGYGMNYTTIEAGDEKEADNVAYEMWRDDAETNAVYGVVGIATDELKDLYL